MLLVCAGPDSFQALRKAQDLERAYREKYDPSGISIERVASTKLEALAERMGSVGLFAQRRCLRVTNLVASWKKADWDRAAKLFARDAEQTIVISVEDEIDPTVEKTILSWDRSRIYRHFAKTGKEFEIYAEQLAKEKNMEFVPALREFARDIEGDAWAFWNALPRFEATKTLPDLKSTEISAFAKSDLYLLGSNEKRLEAFKDGEDLLALLLQQARQGLRTVANLPDGRTPAFTQRKWEHLSAQKQKNLLDRANALMAATVAQRYGSIVADESIALL